MAVVNNTLSEIGDVIIVPAGVPITGLSAISSYTESVSGETGTRLFTREFRYSLDGINYSLYQPLTAPNLAAIPIDPTYDFFIEYRYTRSGTDVSGLLVFNNVTIVGTYVVKDCGITFNNSVFSYFFDSCCDEDVLTWCVNVLEKVYRPGIVSQSLIRGENQNANQEDRDYIDFWRSISCYFGLLVNYARQFENIPTNRDLLLAYLKGRGVYVCEDMPLIDLNYIMNNYWDEMRHRGTVLISKEKGDDINGTPKDVDGELLRLICFNRECDEFLFGISEFNRFGWVGDEWSPLWQGVTDQLQFKKIYEDGTKSVEDLSKYPLINSGFVSIVNDTVPDSIITGSVGTMQIAVPPAAQKAGIGFTTPDFDFSTNISKNLSYELSFYVKSVSGTPLVSVRMYGYSVSETVEPLHDVSSAPLPVSNDMIVDMGLPLTGEWYHVRAILYPDSHTYSVSDGPEVTTPSMGVGNNLKSSTLCCKIIPEIVLDNTGGLATGSIRLWNIRFGPLKTDYSTGFLSTANFVQTWLEVNGGTYTDDQITEIMKFYLLPYKNFLKNNFL